MKKPVGNEIDIAVSTRVRLARNVRGIPYPGKMKREAATELIEKVWEAFDASPLKKELNLYKMDETDPLK